MSDHRVNEYIYIVQTQSDKRSERETKNVRNKRMKDLKISLDIFALFRGTSESLLS